MISSYEESPFERDNKIAQRLGKDLNQYNKLKGKYNLDIGKENRAAIKEYSKEYMDLSKLKDIEKKMTRLNELINSDKIGKSKNIGSFLQALVAGKDNEYINTLMQTPKEQELGNLLIDFYRTKDLGGSNPSTKEVMLSLATLVDRFKTPEANKQIGKRLLDLSRSRRFKGESIVRNLDKGMKLGEFISTIEGDVENWSELLNSVTKDEVMMIKPNGDPYIIPKNKVAEAKKMGLKVYK
jgi:hypothetical protein